MKTILIGIMSCMLVSKLMAQQTKIFSLSPMTSTTEKVNGLVVGIGHLEQKKYLQRINGVNLDMFFLSPFVALYRNTQDFNEKDIRLISSGLNIALGGYYEGTVHNGLSMALYNYGNKSNGLSINGTVNRVHVLNGLHVSAIGNYTIRSNGVNIGITNQAKVVYGVQLGILNKSKHMSGLQIGLFNYTETMKGLQIGFINTNGKRTLPFLNF